jgi:hypothetical protein
MQQVPSRKKLKRQLQRELQRPPRGNEPSPRPLDPPPYKPLG